MPCVIASVMWFGVAPCFWVFDAATVADGFQHICIHNISSDYFLNTYFMTAGTIGHYGGDHEHYE